jgi:hypothetical protein
LRSIGHAPRGLNDDSSRIIYRDGAFVDFGRADLHTLGAGEVINAVKDGFGTDSLDFEVQDLDIQNEAFRLDIVSPRIAMEVRRGDEIQAGVSVEHSYTGDRATTVFAYVVRCLCTNGMYHRECLGARRTARTRRLNADREDAGMFQIEQVRRLTEEVRKDLEPKLAAIRKLADQRADESQLKKFLGQARMQSGGMMQRLREAWAQEGDERTAFGLFNALTRLATHGVDSALLRPGQVALSARQRGMLGRLAGIYANQSNHLCPHCFSVLNSSTTQ